MKAPATPPLDELVEDGRKAPATPPMKSPPQPPPTAMEIALTHALRSRTLHELFALIPGGLDTPSADPAHDHRVVPRAPFVAAVHTLGALDVGGEQLFESIAMAEGAEMEVQELPLKAVIAAMGIVCIGSSEDVVDLVFHAFDTDQSGTLTLDEMRVYLTTVLGFRLGHAELGAKEATPAAVRERLARAHDLARSLSTQTFNVMDVDKSGTISRAEWTAWFTDLSGATPTKPTEKSESASAGDAAAALPPQAPPHPSSRDAVKQPKFSPPKPPPAPPVQPPPPPPPVGPPLSPLKERPFIGEAARRASLTTRRRQASAAALQKKADQKAAGAAVAAAVRTDAPQPSPPRPEAGEKKKKTEQSTTVDGNAPTVVGSPSRHDGGEETRGLVGESMLAAALAPSESQAAEGVVKADAQKVHLIVLLI